MMTWLKKNMLKENNSIHHTINKIFWKIPTKNMKHLHGDIYQTFLK